MLYSTIRPLLFQLEPEKAHELMIKQLNFLQKKSFTTKLYRQKVAKRPVQLMGLSFDNPIGLAAGFDKNGDCIDALGNLGFGFIELGTVTPKPQLGNKKPRLFRIVHAEAIINHMGCNNKGIDYLVNNLYRASYSGIVGVNIGKNKTTPIENSKDDYLICLEKAYSLASYIVINISSPNTPDLRKLQYGELLNDLLGSMSIKQQQLQAQYKKRTPLLVKVAPDLDEAEIKQIADSIIKHNIDGLIATNTSIDHKLVEGLPNADKTGGLSGRPIQQRSNAVIKLFYHYLKEQKPIIGVGGIDSVIAAREKKLAGAQLMQIYSGLIYKGPSLIKDLINYS